MCDPILGVVSAGLSLARTAQGFAQGRADAAAARAQQDRDIAFRQAQAIAEYGAAQAESVADRRETAAAREAEAIDEERARARRRVASGEAGLAGLSTAALEADIAGAAARRRDRLATALQDREAARSRRDDARARTLQAQFDQMTRPSGPSAGAFAMDLAGGGVSLASKLSGIGSVQDLARGGRR